MEPQYRYRCAIRQMFDAVHDGDTVTVDIDLGCNVWLHAQKSRLAGIDAPEIDTQRGREAKAALVDKIIGKPLVVETIKTKAGTDQREKFGRWLLRLHVQEAHGWECVNDWLVANHYAEPYDGGRR